MLGEANLNLVDVDVGHGDDGGASRQWADERPKSVYAQGGGSGPVENPGMLKVVSNGMVDDYV